MSKTKKIIFGSVAVVVLGVGTYAGINYRDRGVVKVQTGKVQKIDSLVQTVTASGEIKPLKYINITANSFGRIMEIDVKEGDRVKKGDMLLKQESIQAAADLRSSEALLQQVTDDAAGQEAAYRSAEANLKTSQADEVRAQADFEKSRLDFERTENLLKEGLVPKSQFDQAKATFEMARAQVEFSKARVLQAEAQLNQADKVQISAHSRITQQSAAISGINDRLNKTFYTAPLDSVVTNLPVRVGESAVPGIQNSIGSNLMTLADLSVITAEVRVDETDIINVKLAQEAEVTVDAIPNKTFKGKVTEVGSSALLRSGQAAGSGASTANSQEAKDFKVVITLIDPSDELKPGLSTTAKVTTAVRSNVLAIPIQALTIREPEKEQKQPTSDPKTAQAAGKGKNGASAKADPGTKNDTASTTSGKKKKEEQGVFVLKDGKAAVVPVKTGITGQTDIEVLSGLKDGDEIVTGSYKTLRTLKTDTKVKADNKSEDKGEQKETK
jgi:HlyD family secretion protein